MTRRLRTLNHLDVAVGLQPIDVLGRDRLGEIDLARQQRRHAGRRVGDRHVGGARDVVLWLVPPLAVGLQHRAHVGLARYELERTGAVGVARRVVLGALAHVGHRHGVVLRAPCLAHHEPVGDLRQQDGGRPARRHLDRVIVDLLDVGDALNLGLGVGSGRARPLQGCEHVVGGEGRAVMERDALAQLEAPEGRGDHLPGLGQRRLELEVLVAAHQRLVHVADQRHGLELGGRVGIERLSLALPCPFELGRLRRRRQGEGGQDQETSNRTRPRHGGPPAH